MLSLFDRTPPQIRRSIQLGWGGAVISALATVLFTFIATSGGTDTDHAIRRWALTSALVTAGLGLGIYLRSRTAAVILLTSFVATRIWFYLKSGSWGVPILNIIFLYCFLEGVRGTFAYHLNAKREAGASAQAGAA